VLNFGVLRRSIVYNNCSAYANNEEVGKKQEEVFRNKHKVEGAVIQAFIN
jgi:hypothetical protein